MFHFFDRIPVKPFSYLRAAPVRWSVTFGVLLLAGCAVGPDYQRPSALADATAPAFAQSTAWKPAQPGQADSNAPWWAQFQDATLNQLLAQAMQSSQTLAQAQAQYRQALALVPAAQAAYMPTLGLTAGAGRSEAFTQGVSNVGNSHAWSLQAGWEPDFWGRVSRSVELAGAAAQASADDLAAARLALQASLVNDYLQLRMLDRQSDLYDRIIDGYTKAWHITQAQVRLGVASKTDVELANATLASAQAQAQDIALSRAQLEHAIAVLVGKLPAQLSIAPLAPEAALPAQAVVPAIMPSELLERRPDIAAAERRVAQANANIGVVRSAWFPNLSLAASYGNAGPLLDNWFYTPYEAWAVGGTLAATLFDGGLRTAQNDQAKAAFDAAAAAYRQTVLNGFQEVEDNLSAISQLQRELEFQTVALQSSRVSERATLSQYRAGTTPYSTVITVQAVTLSSERAVLQLQARLYAASVTLVKAIGGGWHASL
jgi:NodT family efflux transporter outer membrane factor (OMF) lipoprotein